MPSVTPVLIPEGQLEETPGRLTEVIFHQDIHAPFEDGPPTNRPLETTLPKA